MGVILNVGMYGARSRLKFKRLSELNQYFNSDILLNKEFIFHFHLYNFIFEVSCRYHVFTFKSNVFGVRFLALIWRGGAWHQRGIVSDSIIQKAQGPPPVMFQEMWLREI